jgi:hypothetical protein
METSMNEKLQICLEYFKKYTIEMIFNLRNDDINNFEVALEKREQIIEKINNLNFDRIEFKEICEEFGVVPINDELSKIVNYKKDEMKEKILRLKKSQNANNIYQSISSGSNIFSKKV